MSFDPRALSQPVHDKLLELRKQYDSGNGQPYKDKLKEQHSQAVELYTYLSTWGLMRLRAEEQVLDNSQPAKQGVVQGFFDCLEQRLKDKAGHSSLKLENLKKMDLDDYLGVTGLGMALAREFGFWAEAVYSDVKDKEQSD